MQARMGMGLSLPPGCHLVMNIVWSEAPGNERAVHFQWMLSYAWIRQKHSSEENHTSNYGRQHTTNRARYSRDEVTLALHYSPT